MLNNGLSVYEHFLGEVIPGKKIISPIRPEQDPSFSIYAHRKRGQYWWKDNGIDKFGDYFDFIIEVTGCNFKEAVEYCKTNILNIGQKVPDFSRLNDLALQMATQKEVKKAVQQKAMIIPEFRKWNEDDEAYFQSTIRMSCQEMQDAWYLPVSSVRIISKGKDYIIRESEHSPIYVIRFPSGNFKVYRPKEPSKRKWISNVEKELDFYMLDECNGGEVVFIQSGNRDCAAIRKHTGIDSFALNSESAELPSAVFLSLKAKYKKVYVLYDNDTAGTKGADKLYFRFGIPALNYVYKQFGVNDFCDLLENKKDKLDEFILFLYAEI